MDKTGKVCVCGHFGGDKTFLDGQTVKTKNIYQTLFNRYGDKEVSRIDTYCWKKHPITFINECIGALKKSKNLVILPAQNGVKIFIPFFLLLNLFYHRKIFYIVIGGWLPEMLNKNRILSKQIKKLDRVFVETKNMKEKLKALNITNVDVLVNFKNIKTLKEDELVYNVNEPYKLCIFSRIMKEKGVEDAIQVVKRINEEAENIIYELDIYGPIDEGYTQRFQDIIKKVPNYIKYKGKIDSYKSTDVLKAYYMLLFPTKFKTEGIPGTVIDALSAGIPIVASSWENCTEIIEDKKVGYIYRMDDLEEFYNILKELSTNPYSIEIKKNCLNKAETFNADNAIDILVKQLGE